MATSKELRVGIFVLAGLIVAGIVVFLIGDEKKLFSAKVIYHTNFRDVQGLKVGAPVRLGGIDIGMVSSVGHSEDPGDSRLYVDLHVVKSEAVRIRRSTTAQIANKGLLGDKMIDLQEGVGTAPPLAPNDTIQSVEPTDFGNLFAELGSMAQQAGQILRNLDTVTATLANTEFQADLRGSLHSIRVLLTQAAEGNGYVHRLVADPNEADRVSHAIGSFDKTLTEVNQTFAEARKVMGRVNEGPGLAHDLIYNEAGTDVVASFGGAAGEIAGTLKGIRESRGLAHVLLYGGPGDAPTRMVDNLAASSDDLRKIMADLHAGKGTLGALLVDPSVYEDVKRVLGDVQRNDVLRALVRYSIKQDEKKSVLGVDGASKVTSPH